MRISYTLMMSYLVSLLQNYQHNRFYMETKMITAWPSLHSEPSTKSTMTAYPTSQKNTRGVVKLLPMPEPPDEATISRLNTLAGQHPFCRLHYVKKHELL